MMTYEYELRPQQAAYVFLYAFALKEVGFLRKPLLGTLFILIGVVIGIAITSVLHLTTGYSLFNVPANQPEPPAASDNTELIAFAYTVMEDIIGGDFVALSRAAHPSFGVVFSPYPTISLTADRCFQAEQIAGFASDTNVYVWGVNDGTGEPIEMTALDYFAEYVLNRDYMSASMLGINRIVKSGNALDNIADVFPDARFVDFHIPGDDKDSAEDCDWSSLRLGFEEYNGKLWLTLVLHSKWTT